MKNLFLAGMFFLAAAPSFADKVDLDGPKCDRSLGESSLTDAEKKSVNKNGYALRFEAQKGYVMAYIFGEANYDPELVMGVYSSASEHSRKLGSFIKESKLLTSYPAPEYDVRYKQEVPWLSDSAYTLRLHIARSGKGYALNSKLLDSNDADFAPRWADSYFFVQPSARGGSFVVACNYMLPRGGSFKGRFNDTARDRMNQVAKNLLNWVKQVSADVPLSAKYRFDLKRSLGERLDSF